MADLDSGSGLTDDERAYFESGGEKVPESLDNGVTTDNLVENDEREVGAEPEGGEPQGQPEQNGERKRNVMVPHHALHEAREELKREREDRRRFEETVNQRLAIMMGGGDKPKEPEQPPAPPDRATDPLGRMEWLEKQLEQLGQQHQQQQKQTQEQQVRAEVEKFVVADEADARAQAPKHGFDYDEAKQHVIMSRGKEIHALYGGKISDDQIWAMLREEEQHMRLQAIQSGQRFSVVVMQNALARGYQPGASKAAQQNGEERIAGLATAQAENRTLSTTRGTSAGGEMTAAKLATLSDEDFRKWTTKNKEGFRRLAGG